MKQQSSGFQPYNLLFFYMSGLEGSKNRNRVDVMPLTGFIFFTVLRENKLLKPASIQGFKPQQSQPKTPRNREHTGSMHEF